MESDKGEQSKEESAKLRMIFISKYQDWVRCKQWQDREIKWLDYCAARDAYLGFSWDYFQWKNTVNYEPS